MTNTIGWFRKTLLLKDLLAPSSELHRAYNRFATRRGTLLRDRDDCIQDIEHLLNAVVCSLSANKERPLDFDLDSPDTAHRLTLQALYLLTPLYKHVRWLNTPEVADIYPTPSVVYVSFEQCLLKSTDLDTDLFDKVSRANLIKSWRKKIKDIVKQVGGNSDTTVVKVYSDLFSNAAITGAEFEVFLLKKRLGIVKSDEATIVNRVETINKIPLRKVEDKATRDIQQLLCMLLNKIPPNAVRAFYLNQYSENNWTEFAGCSLPENVPSWLFKDTLLADTLTALNHRDGINFEAIAREIASRHSERVSLPEMSFLSPVEQRANVNASKILKEIAQLERLINTLRHKTPDIGQRRVLRSNIDQQKVLRSNIDLQKERKKEADDPDDPDEIKAGNFTLVKLQEDSSNELRYVWSYILKNETDAITVQLNPEETSPKYEFKRHAMERFGPWFAKDNEMADAAELRTQLERIDSKWLPQFEKKEPLKTMSFDKIEYEGESRFKYFPPHWTPGTWFHAHSRMGLFLGGAAFITNRTEVVMSGKQHCTLFDFLIRRPPKKLETNFESLRRFVARLHSHMNIDTPFPTKTGMNSMRSSALKKLSELRTMKEMAIETLEWRELKDTEKREVLGALEVVNLPIYRPSGAVLANRVILFDDADIIDALKTRREQFDADGTGGRPSAEKKKALKDFDAAYAIILSEYGPKDSVGLPELLKKAKDLQKQLEEIEQRLRSSDDIFRLARTELENSMLLRSEDEMSMSQAAASEDAASSVVEQKLFNAIPYLSKKGWVPQAIRRDGKTLLKSEKEFAVHVANKDDVEHEGWLTYAAEHKHEASGESAEYENAEIFCLAVLKYLGFLELCLRKKQKSAKDSSLPSLFLKRRFKHIVLFLHETIGLAFSLYHKYKDKGKDKGEIPKYASYHELKLVLQELTSEELTSEEQTSTSTTIMETTKNRSSDDIVNEIVKGGYSVVASTNMHEMLMSYLKKKTNEADKTANFSLYMDCDNGQILLNSDILNSMTYQRRILCQELWWRAQFYSFGSKMYNRGYAITSKLNESVANAMKTTLVLRFKKSCDVSFRSLRKKIVPEQFLLPPQTYFESGNGTRHENALLRYIKLGEAGLENKVSTQLALTCLYQQLLFSHTGSESSMGNVLHEMYEISERK